MFKRGEPVLRSTVNVDISTCINFREFMKTVHFACIKICVLSITGSLCCHKSNFHCVYIIAHI